MKTRGQARLLQELIEQKNSLVRVISMGNHMSKEKTKELRLKFEAINAKIAKMLG